MNRGSPWNSALFRLFSLSGIGPAETDGMKLMQESYNWVCALFLSACSIMGPAKSPTIILPLRAEPSV
jgi:hypothetical protein